MYMYSVYMYMYSVYMYSVAAVMCTFVYFFGINVHFFYIETERVKMTKMFLYQNYPLYSTVRFTHNELYMCFSLIAYLY